MKTTREDIKAMDNITTRYLDPVVRLSLHRIIDDVNKLYEGHAFVRNEEIEEARDLISRLPAEWNDWKLGEMQDWVDKAELLLPLLTNDYELLIVHHQHHHDEQSPDIDVLRRALDEANRQKARLTENRDALYRETQRQADQVRLLTTRSEERILESAERLRLLGVAEGKVRDLAKANEEAAKKLSEEIERGEVTAWENVRLRNDLANAKGELAALNDHLVEARKKNVTAKQLDECQEENRRAYNLVSEMTEQMQHERSVAAKKLDDVNKEVAETVQDLRNELEVVKRANERMASVALTRQQALDEAKEKAAQLSSELEVTSKLVADNARLWQMYRDSWEEAQDEVFILRRQRDALMAKLESQNGPTISAEDLAELRDAVNAAILWIGNVKTNTIYNTDAAGEHLLTLHRLMARIQISAK